MDALVRGGHGAAAATLQMPLTSARVWEAIAAASPQPASA